jgi:hypothetical protein
MSPLPFEAQGKKGRPTKDPAAYAMKLLRRKGNGEGKSKGGMPG